MTAISHIQLAILVSFLTNI